MKSNLPFVSLAAFLLIGFQATAAEIKSAAEVIKSVQGTEEAPDSPKESQAKKLKGDLQRFANEAKNLTPQNAAAQWLQLVESYWKLPMTERYSRGVSLSARELLVALPPAAAWPDLSRLINARPAREGAGQIQEIALRLISATLQNDRAGQQKELDALKKVYRDSPRQMMFAVSAVQHLNEAMIRLSDDPKQLQALIEAQISAVGERGMLRLPNLVALLGEPAAEALLRKALVTSFSSFDVTGEATGRLARKLALELIEQLKSAPWSLIDNLESIELYEALNKRFPAPAESEDELDLITRRGFGGNYERSHARSIYVLALIMKGRTDEAIAELEKQTAGAAAFLQNIGSLRENAGQISKFMHQILSAKPNLEIWENYVQVASRAGDSEEMLKLLQDTLAAGKVTAKTKADIQNLYYRALLAADKVDEALKEMDRVENELQAATDRESAEHLGELAGRFAHLASVLEKPELLEKAAGLVRKLLAAPDASENYQAFAAIETTALHLAESGKLQEAQNLLLEALKAIKKDEPSYGESFVADNLLRPLAYIYELNSQPAEVLALFEAAPWWGVEDLGAVRFEGGAREDSPPLHLLAARALAKTGKNDEALRIVRTILSQNGGYDPAYELLLEAEPDPKKAIDYLDELFARDRFEERPLIWKAHLLNRQGQREQAEKIIRQAIAIDPSDGEQGPGRRMRAYAVLAEIRKGSGDAQETTFLENVGRSIRLSEKADKVHEAGLISRALKMYQEALGFFADAYCVQSRLALRMSELGRHAEAEAHYQKAYELMPDSFGRVESHCFGCEAIFGDERAQSVAEKVFARLIAASPEKPQLHYLLGYLRKEQGNYEEAGKLFRAAVKLDPDYLNAWKELQNLSGQVFLSSPEHTAIVTNIFRLDPLGRHVRPAVTFITDLPALYQAAAKAYEVKIATSDKLLPLPASKAQLDELRKRGDADDFHRFYSEENQNERSPGRVISQQAVLSAAGSLLDWNQQF